MKTEVYLNRFTPLKISNHRALIIKLPLFLVIFSIVFKIIVVNAQNSIDKKEGNTSLKTIVPKSGYKWPMKDREYCPTQEWLSDSIEKHGIDPVKMLLADNLAKADDSFRSLLIIKDGYIVFEKYYYGGGQELSSEVWSVTKSFTSALVGIAIDKGNLEGIDKLMIDYLPNYPKFKNISIKHVLTHTTGLNWDEGSQETWIQLDNWIAEALNRESFSQPGQIYLYSSGNSHFLSELIKESTGKTPGEYAKEYLFDPIGIKCNPSNREEHYSNWQELHIPVPGSWRQDNKGLEIGGFGFLYLNKGKWYGKILISERWVEESTRDHIITSDNKRFGFHWVVSKRQDNFLLTQMEGRTNDFYYSIP